MATLIATAAFGTADAPQKPSPLATNSPAGSIVWPERVFTHTNSLTLVTPHCATAPTPAQVRAAQSLVDRTESAIAKFTSLSVAKADGHKLFKGGGVFAHYINWNYVNDDPKVLDPSAIQALIYVNLLKGPVLIGAMYMMRDNQVGQAPPMPGGCLMEWHDHTNMCFSTTSGIGVALMSAKGCPAGSVNHVSQPMIHVWTAPIPGGPLAVNLTMAQMLAAAAKLST
jgi:hypothetical protein